MGHLQQNEDAQRLPNEWAAGFINNLRHDRKQNPALNLREASKSSLLKRRRASDVVVDQIQRYMGYVQDALLEPGQSVEGIIVAQEDDLRIQCALFMIRNIRFMKYRVEFHLNEAG